MIHNLFSSTLNILHKNLDMRQQRHTVLSSNIANVETPGFIAKDLRFEASLQHAANLENQSGIQRTHARHLSPLTAAVEATRGQLIARPSDDIGQDLNTVSVDQEMASLTTNAFHYNASTEILSRMFSSLRRAINEGRP